MGYKGQTFQIPCSRGGLNHNQNIDEIPPEAMVHPSRNLNLHRGGREPRGGTSLVNASAYSGTPRMMGLFDYTLINGNQFIMAAGGDGTLYKDDTTDIADTTLGTNKITSMVAYNNLLYVSNGHDNLRTWNGTDANTTSITNDPTDWSGGSMPTQLIIHGSGNSVRMWALGCANNPNTLYVTPSAGGAAAVGDFDFSNGNIVLFHIDTVDGHGLKGAVVFGDRLIVFGHHQSYVIDDTDTNIANWGYKESQWWGGAASHRLIVRVPNDIVCMDEDGTIYSVSAAESYGDYKRASLTRPARVDEWIKEFIDLSKIDQFHATYNPVLRAIDFFMVYSGQTEVTMALRYFTDRGPEEGWLPQDNQDANSGYSASTSALVRAGTGDFQVYTGDYSGNIWKLEQANKNDNSNAYYAGFKTANLAYDDPRRTKKYAKGRVVMQPKGSFDLQVKTWIDGVVLDTETVSMSGTGGLMDSFTLGTSLLGGNEIIDDSFAIGNVGKRIQQEFFNSSVNESFFVSKILTDHKILGSRP